MLDAEHRERFLAKIKMGAPDECWPWQASTNSRGYGLFRVHRRTVQAHRIAWTLAHAAPGRLCVCHRCDNPPCCNPSHLFLGTVGDNNADKAAKGRASGGSKPGEQNHCAKLTAEKVRELRQLYTQGVTQYRLAKRFGISQATTSRIIRREKWVHVD